MNLRDLAFLGLRTSRSNTPLFAAILCVFASTGNLTSAQEAGQAAAPPKTSGETVELPTFTVSEELDKGYLASNSISGTRINTPIKDLPFAVTAFTQEFIQDIGARSLFDVVQYSSGVRSGAMEFLAGDANFMIRGFAQAPQKDGFYQSAQGNIYVDTSNIERVEVVKGPATLLYGQIAPGGTVNIITKRPQDKAFTDTTLKFGSYDYKRATLDINQPFVADSLLFRINGVWENNFEYAKPSKTRTTVVSPSLTWKIAKNLSLTVKYQDFERRETPPAFFLPNMEAADPAGVVAAMNSANGYPFPSADVYGTIGLSLSPYGSADVDRNYNDQSNPFLLEVAQAYNRRFNYLSANDARITRTKTLNAEIDATLGEHWKLRGIMDYNGNSVTLKATGYGGVFIAPPGSLVYANNAWQVSPLWASYTSAQQYAAFGAWATALNQNINAAFGAQNGTPAPWIFSRRQRYVDWHGNVRSGQAEAAGDYKFDWGTLKVLVGAYAAQSYFYHYQVQNRGTAASPFFHFWDVNPNSPTYYIDTTTDFNPADLTRVSVRDLQYLGDKAAYTIITAGFFDDRLTVVGGTRYNQSVSSATNFLGSTPADIYGQGYKAHYTTPQLGAGYKLTRDVTLYGSYSTSYQIPTANGGSPFLSTLGFVNGAPVSIPGAAAKPTTGEGLEAGVKTSLLNGRISTTLSVYQITQDNVTTSIQPIINGANVNLDIQGAGVRSRGVELEATFSPTDNLQIFASATDDDVRNYKEPAGQSYFLGAVPENVSRYLGNLWARYSFTGESSKGLWVGGGFNYSSPAAGVSLNKFMYDRSIMQWNSVVGYDWRHGKTDLTFAINWDNMFNTLVIPAQQARGLPSRWTASVKARF